MFDYHCSCCGFNFFTEEGYNADEDVVKCPWCNSEVQGKINEPIIISIRGHYEAYFNGKFICSGDTRAEVEKELKEV